MICQTFSEKALCLSQGLSKQICPDAEYTVLGIFSNEEQVCIVAEVTATHTGAGGPLPPSDPPFKSTAQLTYHMTFDEYDKITKLHKVFDIYTFWKQFQWPLPGVD